MVQDQKHPSLGSSRLVTLVVCWSGGPVWTRDVSLPLSPVLRQHVGAPLRCDVQASRCGDFCGCGPWAIESKGFSSCGAWV